MKNHLDHFLLTHSKTLFEAIWPLSSRSHNDLKNGYWFLGWVIPETGFVSFEWALGPSVGPSVGPGRRERATSRDLGQCT